MLKNLILLFLALFSMRSSRAVSVVLKPGHYSLTQEIRRKKTNPLDTVLEISGISPDHSLTLLELKAPGVIDSQGYEIVSLKNAQFVWQDPSAMVLRPGVILQLENCVIVLTSSCPVLDLTQLQKIIVTGNVLIASERDEGNTRNKLKVIFSTAPEGEVTGDPDICAYPTLKYSGVEESIVWRA